MLTSLLWTGLWLSHPSDAGMEDRAAVPLSSLLLKEHRRPIKLNVPWLKLLARSRFLCGEGGNGAATCRGHQGCRESGMRPGGHALILREPAWSRPTPARPKPRDLALEPSPSAWEEAAALVKRGPKATTAGRPCLSPPFPQPRRSGGWCSNETQKEAFEPFNLCDRQWHCIQSTLRPDGAGTARVRGSQDTAHTWPGQTDERAGAET